MQNVLAFRCPIPRRSKAAGSGGVYWLGAANIKRQRPRLEVRKMKTMNDLERCPQHIVIPRHFRRNGSCRCDDPNHHEMEGWGYTWSGKRWMVPEDAWEDCDALGG
jgi:hypothetical protein